MMTTFQLNEPCALVVEDNFLIRMEAIVQMPGELDGFALTRQVATTWPHISIFVASGHARPGPNSMPHNARFIAKLFSADVVHAHLREMLPDGQKPIPLM